MQPSPERPDVTYLALADELEAALRRMSPAARMPSENALAADYAVSRITARSALRELEQRLLVRRTRGSGTFVALRLPYVLRAGESPSWSRLVSDAGFEPSYEYLEIETYRAPAAVAHRLEVPRGRTVTQVLRRGFVDGNVAMTQTHWFPVDLVPDLDAHLRGEAPLSTTLSNTYGMSAERRWCRADLSPAPADVASLLELVGRPPTWHIESINESHEGGRVLEYSVGWMRADCFQVTLELGAAPEAVAPNLSVVEGP